MRRGINKICKLGLFVLLLNATGIQLTSCNSTSNVGEKGEKGDQGENGKDGVDGKSAYQIWLDNGHSGTEKEFLEWLKGEKGDTGSQGDKGEKGDAAVSVKSITKTSTEGLVDTYTITYSDNTKSTFTVTNGASGTNGIDGTNGINGNDGTKVTIGENGNWYLDGEDSGISASGSKGENGKDGEDGKSAYQIWLNAGYTGTEEDFLNWLKSSAKETDDNLQGLDYYLQDDGTYAVSVGKAKYLSKIVIPEEYRGKTVTTIIDDGFDNAKVTDLTLPSSITSIGKYAFSDCDISKLTINADIICDSFMSTYFGTYDLTELIIGEDITSIGNNAFSNCSKLTSVSLSSNTTLGEKSFYNCDALETLYFNGTINDWVSSKMGSSEYERINCNTNFMNLYIYDATGTVEYNNCSYNKIEGELTIGEGIDEIASYAFYNINNITKVTITDDVKVINECAFASENGSVLESVVIGNGVIDIGYGGFGQNYNLSSISLGNNLKSIGNKAFYECSKLVTITLPATVNEIGDYAFYNCYSLAEIINLSSLKITKGSTDNGQIAEHAVNVKKTGQSDIESVGDYLFLKSNIGANYLIKYIGHDSKISLPYFDNVQLYSINEYAFHSNQEIEEVTISNSVASIDDYTFYDCSNLTSVIISDSVTTIGEQSFSGCSNLASIVIGNSVTSIGNNAFYNCSKLASVYYQGTPEEWNNINISNSSYYSKNNYLINAARYYYSENEPTNTAYNYWHYVESIPTKWEFTI